MGQPQTTGEVTWDQVIKGLAKQHGVNPTLALAVAQQESGLKADALGPEVETVVNGKPTKTRAVGLMQLLPSTAADLGVDANDPTQNVMGGVKYLKQLSDRYDGDVSKVLMAYNGGPKWVDEGKPTPDAQAYAAKVLASLSQNVRQTQTAAPVTPDAESQQVAQTAGGAASGAASIGPAPGAAERLRRRGVAFGQSMLESVNPMTPEGRQNIASTALSVASLHPAVRGSRIAVYATKGIMPWIQRTLFPAVGAAIGGAGAEAAEQAVGTKPLDPKAIPAAGLMQGAYELGGQAVMWPIRHLGKMALASQVAKTARESIGSSFNALRETGKDIVEKTDSRVRDVVNAVRRAGSAEVAATKTAARNVTGAVRQASAERLADIELKTAEKVATATQGYDELAGTVPSTLETGQKVRAVVAGMPGVQTGFDGPAKAALRMAGDRVSEAAQSGPMVPFAAVTNALESMLDAARPKSMAKPPVGAKSAGFVPPIQARPMGIAAGDRISREEFQQLMAGTLGVDPSHRLTGVLAEIREAGEQVTFADAHRWKRLLDEAVNWDVRAKKHVAAITKGLRTTLRQTMRDLGHEPYETATAAYASVVPLYQEGAGRALIRAAGKDPDRVAKILKGDEPARAIALKDLLVTQSQAGGDPVAGQAAWDAVRSAYTYDHVIRGGIDKLGDRLQKAVGANPEFARAVYGDDAGMRVLSNLDRIAAAYREAVESGAAKATAAKAQGAEAIAKARAAGSTAVEAARAAKEANVAAATETARQKMVNTRRTIATGLAETRAQSEAFERSTVAPYASRSVVEQEGANVLRVAGLGPSNIWGALSAMRLLRGVRGDELTHWASLSDANTQRLVKALLGQSGDRGLALLFRDFGTAVQQQTAAAEVDQ